MTTSNVVYLPGAEPIETIDQDAPEFQAEVLEAAERLVADIKAGRVKAFVYVTCEDDGRPGVGRSAFVPEQEPVLYLGLKLAGDAMLAEINREMFGG